MSGPRFGEYQKVGELDIISVTSIALAIIIAGILATYVDVNPSIAIKGIFLAVLAIAGVGLHVAILGIKMKALPDQNAIFWGVVGFIAITATQALVVITVSSTMQIENALVAKMFYVVSAISEEAFFRYFLYDFLRNISGNTITSMLGTSIIFSVYHQAVYGTMPILLLLVFAGSVILCMVYEFSNNLTSSMVAHALLNFIAG